DERRLAEAGAEGFAEDDDGPVVAFDARALAAVGVGIDAVRRVGGPGRGGEQARQAADEVSHDGSSHLYRRAAARIDHPGGGKARRTAWTASSSLARKRERSRGVMGAGPPVTTPPWRSSSMSSRAARAAPMSLSVKAWPLGPRTRASLARQRAARGM